MQTTLEKNRIALQSLALGVNGDAFRYLRPLMVNIKCPKCGAIIKDLQEGFDFIFDDYCAGCHEPIVNDWEERQLMLGRELCQ